MPRDSCVAHGTTLRARLRRVHNVKAGGASGAAGWLASSVAPPERGDVSSALRAARLASIAVLSASICSSRKSICARWMAHKRR